LAASGRFTAFAVGFFALTALGAALRALGAALIIFFLDFATDESS
jgi:hypothetical protein